MKEYETFLGNENLIYCRWCSRLKESMSIVFNYYKEKLFILFWMSIVSTKVFLTQIILLK